MRPVAVAASVLALAAAGCDTAGGGDAPAPRPPGELAAEAARRQSCPSWPRFRPHWPGDRVGDLPLTNAEWYCGTSAAGGAFVAYSYGDCDPPEGEGGCTLPLEVHSAPLCARPPALSELPVRLRVRGVPARTSHDGKTIELYTGVTTVSATGDDPAVIRRAVDALRPTKPPRASVERRLPPPRGSLVARRSECIVGSP
jgi:hypothetical protein